VFWKIVDVFIIITLYVITYTTQRNVGYLMYWKNFWLWFKGKRHNAHDFWSTSGW